MPIHSFFAARLLAAFLALFAGLAAFTPTEAHAQACTEEPCPGTGDDGLPPMVTINPASGTYTQPTLPVRVLLTDGQLKDGTLQVQWTAGGTTTDMTAAFAYVRTLTTPTMQEAVATGQLAMSAGSNVLSVTMCDYTLCTTSTATYQLGSPGVRVTPNGAWAQVASGAAGTYPMWVRNTGAGTTTFSLLGSCRESQGTFMGSCGAPAVPSVTLAAGDSVSVPLSYPALLPGQEITVRLSARSTADAAVEDAGWAELEGVGTGTAPSAMTIALVDLNSSATVARDQCVTVAIAPGAAMECGDLRLAHGLPALQVLGRTHAPALLYSSAHVRGSVRVYADVRLPVGATVPTTVEVKVFKNDGTFDRTVYPGSQWGPGTARRVSVVIDSMSEFTGVYPYTLQVIAHYPGASYPVHVAGEVAVVNRGASEFGPGWWLAGVEQVVPVSGNRLLRVGGDGSTRIYSPVATGVWVAARVDRPDTMWTGEAGVRYQRRTPQGATISFDSAGRHVRTANRLNQHTRFVYDTSTGRLEWLEVPREPGAAGARLRYRFVHNAAGKVATVEAPDLNDVRSRTVTLGRDAEHRVTSITDPDNVSISFGYEGRYATSRTDRRGVQTAFTYGPGRTVASSRMWLGPAAADSIIHRFEPVEGRGIAAALPLSRTHTLLDGPRTDVGDTTLIWVGRYGAPRRIRDAVGSETLLLRGNASFPALVTEVRRPNANGAPVARQSAVYDAAGRVDSSVVINPLGDGRNTVTRYTYDAKWNEVTSVFSYSVTPGSTVRTALGGIDSTAYDPATGNPLWRQSGDASRRVTFDYHTSGPGIGLPYHVYYPAPQPGVPGGSEEVTYDAFGNLHTTKSPLGFMTAHFRDELGRDTLVITPIRADSSDAIWKLMATGARSRTGYDAAGRVLWTEALGPPVVQHQSAQGVYSGPGITPPEKLRIENTYGLGGELLKVERWSIPDSAGVGVLRNTYTYDRAGRKLTENDGSGGSGSGGNQYFGYDRAGNVTTWTTQRGHVIRTEYDALGRLTGRYVPAASNGPSCPPLTSTCTRFPYYANDTDGGWTVPAEWFIYRYDAAGNQVWAENLDAKVSRSYYPGGALRTDTIRMRTYEGLDYTQHVYGVEYGYDIAGRMASVRHPGNLAGSAQQTDSYSYDPVTGALATVTGRMGENFQYGYDLQGREIWHTYPSGIERSGYDLEGRRIARSDSTGAQGVFNNETLSYDARGKLLHSYTDFSTDAANSDNWYSGLGNLVATHWSNVEDNAANTEPLGVDAMGNQYRRIVTPDGGVEATYRTTYTPGTGRVSVIAKEWPTRNYETFYPDSTYRYYDPSGNVSWAVQATYGEDPMRTILVTRWVGTRNFYSADEKVRVLQTHDLEKFGLTGVNFRGLFSEYRYDALGRRILERTRRDSICNVTAAGECVSTITRFIWSGDQLLWELRDNGSNSADQELTGESPGSGAYYGRVSYLHAGGIDRPLVIRKGYTSIIPHDNWRGSFATGTLINGQRAECTGSTPVNCHWIVWPGWRTTVSNSWSTPPDPGKSDWWGGLVDGMRDASGRMYMRNRYYDPATGQFTQTDPIGLAGGLNTYGFAAGDPVSYSDPYGLCPKPKCLVVHGIVHVLSHVAHHYPGALRSTTRAGQDATEAWAEQYNNSTGIRRAGAAVAGTFSALWTPTTHRRTLNALTWGIEAGAEAASGAASDGPAHGDLSLLSPGEIRMISESGGDAHDMKPNSRYDLYKAKRNGDGFSRGDIYYMRKPQYGSEAPVSTGYNMQDFQ